MLDRRLQLHLASWLGQWPAGPGCTWSARTGGPGRPGTADCGPPSRWTPGASAVLSVARPGGGGPRAGPACTGRLLAALPDAVGQPDWCGARRRVPVERGPGAASPDVGEWTQPTAAGLPSWLRLFDRQVLVVRDPDGSYLAGAGIKRHDAYGHELAVGTVPAARGRGLARRLVAAGGAAGPRRGGRCRRTCTSGQPASARVADRGRFPRPGLARRSASTRAEAPPTGGARTVDPGPDPTVRNLPPGPGSGCAGRAGRDMYHATYRRRSARGERSVRSVE